MTGWKKYPHKSQVKWTVDGLMPDIDPHTKTKHLLLESYLQDWVETLTGNCKIGTGQVTLVDGFCGGGVYRDNDNESWRGSPIRMIQAVEAGWQAVKQRKPYQDLDIAYLFVDARREHTECLKQQIREAGFGELLDTGRCRVETGNFEDHLEDCLNWVQQRGGYSFFFLDPFGLADLPGMSKAILSLGRSEVLLNYMQCGLIRPIGWHRSKGSLPTFLDKYGLANHYDWCKEIDTLPVPDQQRLLHDAALRLFRDHSLPRFAWTFAFMRNPNTVYYYLIHLSNNSTAVSVMRRTLWKYNNLDYQFHYGIFGLGYRTLDDLNQNLQLLDIHQRNLQTCQEKLREQLDRFVFDQEALPFRKLFEGTVEQHPATREDYMGVIHQMVLDGDLEIIREDRSRCTTRIFNKDIIRKAEAKQLILLSERSSERIPQRRKASKPSPSSSKHVVSSEIAMLNQGNLFSELSH